MGFMYMLVERGVFVLLAVHTEVMRRMFELVTVKSNFASATISVLQGLTATQMLTQLGFDGAATVEWSHPATRLTLAAEQTKANKSEASEDKETEKIKRALIHAEKVFADQKAKYKRLEGGRRSSTGAYRYG
jgi:hypothetical protein